MDMISRKASHLLRKWIEENGTEDRKALLDYAAVLVDRYGEAIGAYACEMYDATAAAQRVIVPQAEPAEPQTYGEVARTINGSLKMGAQEAPRAMYRLIKQTGADTTLKNAMRDGAQFAWITQGDTCAFCMVLASRGWQYASENNIRNGHAEHIHANCDCQYAVRFDNRSTIEGYDPKKYLDMYRNAEGRTPNERINSMRRNIYRAKKREKDVLRLEAENPFKNPKTPLKIQSYKQSKHIIGGERYNEHMKKNTYQPSYLIISEEEAQKLVDKYHGTGILKLNRRGEVIQSEKIIDNEKEIGYVVNNRNGKKEKTTGFKIHYSDKGTHIVPMYENQKKYWKERREHDGYDWLFRQKS